MLTDIGANLSHDSFDKDRDEVLARAAQAGVSRIIVTGSCVDSSRQAAEQHGLAQGIELFSTAGMHPHHAADLDSQALQSFRTLAGQAGVVALGEMGLDYHRNLAPVADQRRAFSAQLDLACELGMPCFLHQRDAHEDFVELLRPRLPDLPGVVVHCFTGTADELRDYLDLNLYVGITGWICDERRGEHLQHSVAEIPDDRILIETDAPYLLPRTIRPRPKTRRNEPMYLAEVARVIAQCRNQPPDVLAQHSSANAARLFNLPSA